MLFQIKTINGQKTIVPLTADTGTGAPVGSYLYLEKKSNPQGYLYCDGSTFDETVYPALYQYLGTNVLPDWRELGAKGAEKNTTLIFDSTETDPSTGQAGTQNHDVFTQGEFKDDQLQDHNHSVDVDNQGNPNLVQGLSWTSNNTGKKYDGFIESVRIGRKGTVTRGKSRAVFIYIKATSGLTENQQENVLNTINENNSYSTEEVNTGKKWIDGKPIYRKVVDLGALGSESTWSKNVLHGISNISTVVSADALAYQENGIQYEIMPCYQSGNQILGRIMVASTDIYLSGYGDWSYYKARVILEYTKTTDN